jgi:hypothetical protein
MTAANADPIVQSAARWFWWVAGLSLVNAVMSFSGNDTNFVLGLAMTTLASVAFADNLPVAAALIVLTVGFYFFIGLHAQKSRLWAFFTGIAVYVLDAAIYAKFEDWMSVGFHALAIFYIWKGVTRVRQLNHAQADAVASA